jgi:hypothetical protein
MGGGIDLSSLSDIAEGIYGLTESLQKAGVWLSKGSNWVRIAYVAGGSLLAITALLSITGLSHALPQGKVLSAVKKISK